MEKKQCLGAAHTHSHPSSLNPLYFPHNQIVSDRIQDDHVLQITSTLDFIEILLKSNTYWKSLRGIKFPVSREHCISFIFKFLKRASYIWSISERTPFIQGPPWTRGGTLFLAPPGCHIRALVDNFRFSSLQFPDGRAMDFYLDRIFLGGGAQGWTSMHGVSKGTGPI